MRMELPKLIRKNIASLSPYSTARDEYKGEIGIYLDANENPYPHGFNRYPDPYQLELKDRIARMKQVSGENIFLGNGSDEAIDLLYRIFCEPRIDEVVAIRPSYGMYAVAARINDVRLTEVDLTDDYELDANAILAAVTPRTKLIFLCSPNNPSGNLLRKEEIVRIIEEFAGIVVIDEAYIDFSGDRGFVPVLNRYTNLVILQTLSKAWGMAGLRVGMAFASKEIISYMTRIKYPYNLNSASQKLAISELSGRQSQQAEELREIISQRELLLNELKKIAYVEKVYPSDSNFILIKVPGAVRLYHYLIGQQLIVRDRSKVFKCADTLRITVGTPCENKELVEILKNYK